MYNGFAGRYGLMDRTVQPALIHQCDKQHIRCNMLDEYEVITLKSKIRNDADGQPCTREYRLRKYPSTVGFDMLGDSVELIDVLARKKVLSPDKGKLRNALMSVRAPICEHIDVKLSNGNWQPLNSDTMVNSHVPDREVLAELLLKSHDYNSFFLNSGKLLKIFQDQLSRVKEQTSKISTQFSGLFSQKNKQASEN